MRKRKAINIKRLDIPTYIKFTVDDNLDDDPIFADLVEIKPIVGKEGWYYDRELKTAWFEYGDRAFVDSAPDMFIYELSLENHRPLSQAERDAILLLMRSKIADRKLRDLYYLDEQWRQLRDAVRESAFYTYKFFKQWRAEQVDNSAIV